MKPRRLPRSEAEACPFCGKQPVLDAGGVDEFNPLRKFYEVRCYHRGYPDVTIMRTSLRTALSRWNTRRAPAEKGKR